MPEKVTRHRRPPVPIPAVLPELIDPNLAAEGALPTLQRTPETDRLAGLDGRSELLQRGFTRRPRGQHPGDRLPPHHGDPAVQAEPDVRDSEARHQCPSEPTGSSSADTFRHTRSVAGSVVLVASQ